MWAWGEVTSMKSRRHVVGRNRPFSKRIHKNMNINET